MTRLLLRDSVFGKSALPRYVQIADLLRQRIARGAWPPGTRLPSNEEMMSEFDVSRVTFRQAVDILARDGLVEARQGRGTFITGEVRDDRWLRVETTLADLAEVYRDTKPELLTLAEATAAPPLRPADGTPAPSYFFMKRVHSHQGRPYCVIAIFLDERVFRKQPERFRTETVIPILAAMRNPAIAKAKQTLTIGTAGLEAARHLGIAVNAPVAEVRRVFNAADGTVIYLGEVTYRGDFIHLEMDLKP
jgi:GntR family transcriptional regulator